MSAQSYDATPVSERSAADWSDGEIAAYSRERIDRGSKSFATASRLFAPRERESATMLYAWCRHCDDEIDGQDLGFNTETATTSATQERLARLRGKTLEAIEGRAREPMFVALQKVVERHAIPARLPLDLIEGMAMDVRGMSLTDQAVAVRANGFEPKMRMTSLQDTLLYSYHVAGCVGVMMAMIMGVRDRATLDRACDLGIAFQLTNIARDVRADALVGRSYLPDDWLHEAGVAPGALTDPSSADAVHVVTLRLLDEADRYYASAYHGLAQLPFRSALAIATARRVYSNIGQVVRDGGALAGPRRARVSSARKLRGVLAAISDTLAAHRWGLGGARLDAAPRRDGLWTMSANG